MAEAVVTLSLPCDTVRFRATVDCGPDVSRVEEIVLRALAVRPMTVRDLGSLLALPARLVADVVHALWRVGHLALEPGNGRLRVSPQVADAVSAGPEGVPVGAEREESVVELTLDPLLGQALPPQPRRYAPGPRVNASSGGTGLAGFPAADLLAAATAALRGAADPDAGEAPSPARERRVVGLRQEAGARGRYWRPVLVQPWLEERTGTLGVTIVDPEVPHRFRETGSERLTRLIADNPDAPFTGLLRARAGRRPAVPPEDALVGTLGERADRLPALLPGQRASHHEQLTGTAVHLAQVLQSRIARETEVEPVTRKPLLKAAAELIDESLTQVVVVASRLDPTVLRALRPALQAARGRGVHVLVLLGQPPSTSAPLGGPAHKGGLAPLVLPWPPARAQPGLIVRDDRAALVVGGTAPSADGVLGVLLRAPDGGACPAVHALLDWLASAVPDGSGAPAILPRPSGRPGVADPAAAGPAHLPEPPPPDSADAAAAAAWASAWRAYADGQREILRRRPLPEARWVTSAHHLDLLLQVLRGARRRLVIASQLVDDRVVDDRFLALLRDRLESGVMVTLSYGTTHGPAPAALDALATEFPAALFLVRAPAAVRALVWDDDAVLLAADPLAGPRAGNVPATGSAAGAAVAAPAPRLRLTGAAIADRIASAAGEPDLVTGQVTGTGLARSDGPEPLARIRAYNIAQRVRNRWHADPSAERALEPLTAEADPWPVLEILIGGLPGSRLPGPPGPDIAEPAHAAAPEQPGPPAATDASGGQGVTDGPGSGDELVCAAAAWCLNHRGDRAGAATTDFWWGWLIEHHWQARQFAEAALLRLAHPSGAGPLPALALVAAASGTEVSTMALLTALESEGRTAAEDACLLAVAAAESLRTADDDLAELVGTLLPRVGTPWRDLGEAVLDYHSAARGMPPELLLRPAADRAARSHRLATAWDALARAVDRTQQTQATFIGYKRVQVALFKRSGPFGALEPAGARRDAGAVRAFLSSWSGIGASDERAAGRIIDDVWGQAAASATDLEGAPRKALIDRLVSVLAAARTVIEAEEHTFRKQTAKDATTHREAVRVLADRVQGASADLDRAAAGLGRFECGLAAHALQQISRMTEPEVP